MFEEQLQVGPSAALPRVRTRGLLRFVAQQARDEALSPYRSRDHGLARAGRDVGVVLHRRTLCAASEEVGVEEHEIIKSTYGR